MNPHRDIVIAGDASAAPRGPTFASLPLPPATLENLQRLGYTAMTPIQAASLPLALAGHDLIAQAKTGSGKTAAFALALLANLNPRRFAVQALVLCPTRELADQVTQEMRRLARAEDNIKVLTLCGGATMRPQLASLEHGAHIVVGTPGRIMDHLERGSLKLDALNTLVLDEADRMLDMGFFDDIATVAKQCPKQRQTLLFSATYPEGIAKLAAAFMREPQGGEAARARTRPRKIRQRFYEVTRRRAAARRVAAAEPLPPGQHAGLLQHQAAVPRPGGGAARAGLRGAGTARRPGAARPRPGAGAVRQPQLQRAGGHRHRRARAGHRAARSGDQRRHHARRRPRTRTASAAPAASTKKAGPSAWPAWTRWAASGRSSRPAASRPSGSRWPS